MESRVLRFIDCYEELKKSIPIFAEAFVKYYGEDLREEIERKFSEAIFIGYQDPEYIKTLIITLEKEKTNELLTELTSRLNLDLTVKDLIDSRTLDYPNGHPAKNVVEFYRLYKIGPEGRKEEFIKEGYKYFKRYFPNTTEEEYKEIFETKKLPDSFETLSEDKKSNILLNLDNSNIDEEYKDSFHRARKIIAAIMPDTTVDNFQEKLGTEEYQKLLLFIEGYLEALEEYQKFKDEQKALYEEEDAVKKRKQIVGNKHHKEFIRENIDILPENLRAEVLKEIDKESNYMYLGSFPDKIFGYFMDSPSILEAFKEDKEDLSKLNQWQRESTIEKRIQYFQGFGIDYGDNYEAYLEDERVKEIWPSKERIKAFFESKEKHLNAFYNEFYEEDPKHKEVVEEIERANFLDKDENFDASVYTRKLTALMPNIVERGGNYQLLSLIVINFNNLDCNYMDHMIVHELNHLFELTLQEVVNDSYSTICGWDDSRGSINQIEKPITNNFKAETKRGYELFNEIINELIAQEISEVMHQNDMYVFDDKEDSKIRYTTSYEHSAFLVRNFFQEFKDTIIASRRGNIDLLLSEVGEENIEELNELFHVFYENFGGFKIYPVLQAKQNEEETEATRLYDNLYQKSEEILEKMRKYKANQKEESTKKTVQ